MKRKIICLITVVAATLSLSVGAYAYNYQGSGYSSSYGQPCVKTDNYNGYYYNVYTSGSSTVLYSDRNTAYSPAICEYAVLDGYTFPNTGYWVKLTSGTLNGGNIDLGSYNDSIQDAGGYFKNNYVVVNDIQVNWYTINYLALPIGTYSFVVNYEVYRWGALNTSGTWTWNLTISGGTPTYMTPSYSCVWGTKLSDLTFTDTCFSWTSPTSEVLPVGTTTRYAKYEKAGYDTVTDIPIIITVSPYPVHFKMEVL
jgi:hypothetical protein